MGRSDLRGPGYFPDENLVGSQHHRGRVAEAVNLHFLPAEGGDLEDSIWGQRYVGFSSKDTSSKFMMCSVLVSSLNLRTLGRSFTILQFCINSTRLGFFSLSSSLPSLSFISLIFALICSSSSTTPCLFFWLQNLDEGARVNVRSARLVMARDIISIIMGRDAGDGRMVNYKLMRGKDSEYRLRPKSRVNVCTKYNLDGDEQEDCLDDEYENLGAKRPKRKCRSRPNALEKDFNLQGNESEGMSQSDIFDENDVRDRLPGDQRVLQSLYGTVLEKIKVYKQLYLKEQEELKGKESCVGGNSIPICADIKTFNWNALVKAQKDIGQRTFDVIMMDPPWKLSTSQPSRGVAIQYDSLSDEFIENIPIEKLQKNGFLMIWTINAKLSLTVNMLKKWKYEIVDSIAWVKSTINQKIAKGHGFYLQHAKETCIIGVKGTPVNTQFGIGSDLIFSMRRGQSQKPCETYALIEQLVPNGYYLEIFGRRNNLRDKWVTIGNEI